VTIIITTTTMTMTIIMDTRINPIRMPNIRMGQSRCAVTNPNPVRNKIAEWR